MKKLLLLLTSIILLSSCSKKPSCKDFKTGTFTYSSKIPFTIYRSDTLQIEKHDAGGIEIHNKVVWTSDCTYELTCTDVINGNTNINQLIGHTIFVEITEVTENTYKSTVKSDFMNKEIELIKE